ncbi:GTPase [Anaerostipes sp.]|uniref:GTPase n=1 Tax=Anaerostipes sp. TaxID=1872530 RepID=UPI0025C4C1EC|nr:GTPase [Anaerostipes sp.]MBS7009766.1 GTPase [Anaerostipes sp.]
MKKYILSGCLILLLAASLSGCGTAHIKPQGLSDSQYRLGLKAIETTDKYLGADLSKDLADNQLKHIEKAFEQYHKTDKKTVSAVDSRIEQLDHCLSTKKVSDKKITKVRNQLAKTLNQNPANIK